MKKAIILDLDNTIYPVSSIGEDLFKPVFELIGDSGYRENLDEIKKKMMRTPFQKVANEYGFSDDVVRNGAEILKDLAY
ncbi:MAG TPA: HAD family hydrolase, partial [Flavobacterium sp.]|nr:HAD family hydrolase [Flavobacterium sp.]